MWRRWVDKFSSFSFQSEFLVSPLASLPISQFFFITLPRFMAPHSIEMCLNPSQMLHHQHKFWCSSVLQLPQFTQSSYQTKKNISFLHTQCLATEVGSNGNLDSPPASSFATRSMKCKFFLHHSLLCIEFVSMISLSTASEVHQELLFVSRVVLHCISKLAAALSSANCAVPPGTFLTTLYFRFWASKLPLYLSTRAWRSSSPCVVIVVHILLRGND